LNEVNVQILADPDNLHPTNGSSQIRDEVLQYLHGALINTDLNNGNMRPGICESMPVFSNNNKSLTFKIRKGITWDDGLQVTANDITFTIKASKCNLTNNVSNKFFFENVKEVIADDSSNLQFTIVFKSASEYNLPMWCDYPILQEKKYDFNNALQQITFNQLNDSSFIQEKNQSLLKWANAFNNDAMGSEAEMISGLGPYQLQKWERGQYISIIKKQNHWSAKLKDTLNMAYPEKITFRIAQDPVVQKASFLSQLFDATGALPTRLLFELQQDKIFNKNYHSRFIDTYGYTYIAMNMRPDGIKQNHILDDINVRRALAYSSQIDNMINVVNNGINKRVAGPVAPLKIEYNQDLKLIPFDLKKAIELLDKSGWKDSDNDGVRDKIISNKKVSLELELIYFNTIPDWKDMAVIISEGMKQAGVLIKPVACDYPTWMEKVSTHNYDLAMGSWNTSSFPEDYSQLWSTASYIGNGSNYTGFGNAASDSLINAIAKETDASKKIQLEKKMQQLIYDEQPYIFLYGLVRRCVVHKRFDHATFYAERPGILYAPLQLSPLYKKSSVNN
jgi:peptide/nickel transport system substrate-binding protein